MSPPESSGENSSGFQRGFLLDKPANGSKRQVSSRKSTNALPSNSSERIERSERGPASSRVPEDLNPGAESFSPGVKSNGSKKTRSTRPSEQKDSGWAKGFLTNKKAKKTKKAIVGEKLEKHNHDNHSKVQNPAVERSKCKESGWSKGFLNKNMNNNQKKNKVATKENILCNVYDSARVREQKDQSLPTEKARKTTRSNILLSIDDVPQDRFCNTATPIIATAKKTPISTATSSTKPLIRVISEDGANEAVARPTIPHPLGRNASTDESGVGFNVTTTTNFETKSLMAPLISIMKEDQDGGDGKASSILVHEVSTTRRLDHRRGDRGTSLNIREKEEHSHSPSTASGASNTNDVKGKIHYHKTLISSSIESTDLLHKNNNEKQGTISNPKNGEYGNDDINILGLQQDLERLFSRASKDPQRNNLHEHDYLQTVATKLKSPELRRYAWTYLLQQKQQEQFREKSRRKNMEEGNGCDFRIQALFDAEFSSQLRISNESITSIDVEGPLESILKCVETDVDRRMALQAVLIIQEYFLFRYQEQQQHKQDATPKGPEFNVCIESLQQVLPLFVCLAGMSKEVRRTRLVQTAWETAILLCCFCIRRSLGLQPSSSWTLPRKLWKELDSLLHQQVTWQESKTKVNAAKVAQLNNVRMKFNNVLEESTAQQVELNSSLGKCQEIVVDLEQLIEL